MVNLVLNGNRISIADFATVTTPEQIAFHRFLDEEMSHNNDKFFDEF